MRTMVSEGWSRSRISLDLCRLSGAVIIESRTVSEKSLADASSEDHPWRNASRIRNHYQHLHNPTPNLKTELMNVTYCLLCLDVINRAHRSWFETTESQHTYSSDPTHTQPHTDIRLRCMMHFSDLAIIPFRTILEDICYEQHPQSMPLSTLL